MKERPIFNTTRTKIHTCQCGFTWQHGLSGQHACESFYRKKILTLESDQLKLVAENAALKREFLVASQYAENDTGSTDYMRAYNMFSSPSTDLAVAEIKAEGVREFADHMQTEKPHWEPEDWESMDFASEQATEFSTKLKTNEVIRKSLEPVMATTKKTSALPVRVTAHDMRETLSSLLLNQEEAEAAAAGFNQCLLECAARTQEQQ